VTMLAIVGVLGALLTAAVLYIRGAEKNRADLAARTATADGEAERRKAKLAEETRAADELKRRVDDDASKITDAAGAADFLRQAGDRTAN
jgi:hypothetical protein